MVECWSRGIARSFDSELGNRIASLLIYPPLLPLSYRLGIESFVLGHNVALSIKT